MTRECKRTVVVVRVTVTDPDTRKVDSGIGSVGIAGPHVKMWYRSGVNKGAWSQTFTESFEFKRCSGELEWSVEASDVRGNTAKASMRATVDCPYCCNPAEAAERQCDCRWTGE